jgi:hypothetical protein
VELVNLLFHSHAHIEDNHVFPMIAPFAPQVVSDFEAQHDTDHELSEALVKCLARFTETNSPEQNILAGYELMQQFNAFLAFNVEHMRKEETVVAGILWEHYTDNDLLLKVQEIGSSIPPEKNKHYTYWMLKGMATHEIIGWFNSIKHTAPPQVFDIFCHIAEEALPARQWNIISDTLHEGALLA